MSYASRVIGVDDYNAAVMLAPGSCPLLAAGDLRSGAQVGRASHRVRGVHEPMRAARVS